MINMTGRNRETVDACRFCWMCRHICPVGNATGQERNTSRARALGISLVLRNIEPVASVIDNAYECMLCGACTKECVTGWDPAGFTTEIRLQGSLEGVMPDSIASMIDKVEATGNPYGEPSINGALADEIATLPESSHTLLFLGADARYRVPDQAINAIRLLKKGGVDFSVLADERDSGYSLYFLTGPSQESQLAMKKSAEQLAGFKQLVVLDPCDASFFIQKYREWNVPLAPSVQTYTSALDALIHRGGLVPKRGPDIYTFQDPFALSRHLEETAPARNILNACGTIKEMLLHGKDCHAAGSLLMREYLPHTMTLVAASRWLEAKNTGANVLVTASPAEYACLDAVRPSDMNLMTLEEVVLKCL